MSRYGPPTAETDRHRSSIVLVEEGRRIRLPVHPAILLQRRQLADLACHGFRYRAALDRATVPDPGQGPGPG